jgi:HEAT repeat protein
MDLSLESEDSNWNATFTGRGVIYNLVSAAMNKSDAAERIRAVVALGKSDDPRAVRPLMDLLEDADPAIRLAATTELGHLKSGRPVDDLIERLRDRLEQPEIRKQAVNALASIQSTGAIRGLREFVADENEDPVLRAHAEKLLKGVTTW